MWLIQKHNQQGRLPILDHGREAPLYHNLRQTRLRADARICQKLLAGEGENDFIFFFLGGFSLR